MHALRSIEIDRRQMPYSVLLCFQIDRPQVRRERRRKKSAGDKQAKSKAEEKDVKSVT